jgi:beta-lactamase regulating signal transducer with metallopeptidase domain
MAETIRTILIMSASGSILALLLFVLKPFIKNRLPKSAQYYLWLVVAAALLVPISRFVALPANNAAIPSIADTIDRVIVTNEEIHETVKRYQVVDEDGYIGIPVENQPIVDELVPDPRYVELWDWCAIIWWIGAIIMAAYFLCAYSHFVEKMKRTNVPSGIDCAVPVYRNAKAATPMLIGLFNPIIVLPDQEYTEEQLHSVLLHELTHLRRKDVLVKWLSVLACAVHWFNPIVWLARREIDRACELSCDEAVILNLDKIGKQIYGDTLIYVAADSKTPRAVLSTTMCEEKKNLKERLAAIMESKKHTRAAIVVSVAVIAVAVIVACALGAGSGDSASQREQQALQAVDTYFSENLPSAVIVEKWFYPQEDLVRVSYRDENSVWWVRNAILERMGSYCRVIRLEEVPEDPNATPAPEAAVSATVYVWRANLPLSLEVENVAYKFAVFKGEPTLARDDILEIAPVYTNLREVSGALKGIIDTTKYFTVAFYQMEPNIDKATMSELVEMAMVDFEGLNFSYSIGLFDDSPDSTDLETVVSKAIIAQKSGSYEHIENLYQTEAHVTLKVEEDGDITTVYAYALSLSYVFENGKLTEDGGSSMPVAISFNKDANGAYSLSEYWMPKDGSYYLSSIQERFPKDLWDKVDTQLYAGDCSIAALRSAQRHFA